MLFPQREGLSVTELPHPNANATAAHITLTSRPMRMTGEW